MEITEQHIKEICKIGQGHECCRYLACGANGFRCLKHSSLRKLLDDRVTSNTIIARGDNCDGNEKVEVSN